MSRISPSLARRLDRLSRRAHRFHQFAHHPLCASYAGEVLAVGRRARVCRGCALAMAGGAAGSLAGFLPPVSPAMLGAAALGLAALTATAAGLRSVRTTPAGLDGEAGRRSAAPPSTGPEALESAALSRSKARPSATPDRAARTPKLLTRALPAAIAVAAAVAGTRAAAAAGLLAGTLFAVATAALAATVIFLYRRRGPDRGPCLRCPEREGSRACSGLAPIARREAAFGRLAGRLLRDVRP